MDSTHLTGATIIYTFDGRNLIVTAVGAERDKVLNLSYASFIIGLYAEAHMLKPTRQPSFARRWGDAASLTQRPACYMICLEFRGGG